MTILTDQDYREALREVERLMNLNPALGSRDSDRLIDLSVIVEEWENKALMAKGLHFE